jgi:hypothetical protein
MANAIVNGDDLEMAGAKGKMGTMFKKKSNV